MVCKAIRPPDGIVRKKFNGHPGGARPPRVTDSTVAPRPHLPVCRGFAITKRMTIGVTGWSFDGEDAARIQLAASSGFGAIQIGVGCIDDCRNLASARWRRRIQAASRSNRIEVAGLALNVLERWGVGKSPTGAARRRALALVGIAAKTATELGASLVYVPSFGRNRIDGDRSLDCAAAFLGMACRIAADYNLTLASENTLDVAGNLALIGKVGHPSFRILIDTYNPLIWGHDTAELIAGLGPYLCSQAHVKDGIGGATGSAPLGDGEGKVHEALRAFATAGFAGTFFLENDYRGPRRHWPSADIRRLCEFHSTIHTVERSDTYSTALIRAEIDRTNTKGHNS